MNSFPAGNVTINIEFTDRAVGAVPQLKQLRAQLHSPHAQRALSMTMRGDNLRIEGIPTDPPLYVVARAWTLMHDETRLLLALGLLEEL